MLRVTSCNSYIKLQTLVMSREIVADNLFSIAEIDCIPNMVCAYEFVYMHQAVLASKMIVLVSLLFPLLGRRRESQFPLFSFLKRMFSNLVDLAVNILKCKILNMCNEFQLKHINFCLNTRTSKSFMQKHCWFINDMT